MWQRSDGGERTVGGHRREDSVPAVEIGEAFVEEMAFDLNFAGRTIFHMWEMEEGESTACAPLHCPFCPHRFLSFFSSQSGLRVALHLLTLTPGEGSGWSASPF